MRKFGLLRAMMALVVILACTSSCFGTLSTTVAEAAAAKINYSKKTLYVGRKVKLKIKNSKDTFTWKSSNKKIAKVAADGTVTAVKKGTATVTAKTADGKKTFTCKVTVKNPYITPIARNIKALAPGQTLQLGVTGATPVKFTSSNPEIAKVDAKTGLVTAVKAGEDCAVIKAKCDNGKTYKRNIIVIDPESDPDDADITDPADTEPSKTGSEDAGGSTAGGNTSGGSTAGGNTPGGNTSGNTGSDSGKKCLSVPVIPDNCYGLFNPQEKEEWYTDSAYEVSDELEFAEVCKMEMDKCNPEFAVHYLEGNAEELHNMFLELCGKYSLIANYAGYTQESFEQDNWFNYRYMDSPDYNELLGEALQNGIDVFTVNTETFRPIYSYASQASTLLRYDGYPAAAQARRVLSTATDLVEVAIGQSSDLNEVILNINNIICAATTYDTATDADRSTLVETAPDGTLRVLPGRDVTGIFDNGLGVCQAYTALFGLCMDILGVPNERVCNEADTHIWNRIYVDGEWYHVDVTWNDSLNNAYFMVKDSELSGLDARYSPSNPSEHVFLTDYLSR